MALWEGDWPPGWDRDFPATGRARLLHYYLGDRAMRVHGTTTRLLQMRALGKRMRLITCPGRAAGQSQGWRAAPGAPITRGWEQPAGRGAGKRKLLKLLNY